MPPRPPSRYIPPVDPARILEELAQIIAEYDARIAKLEGEAEGLRAERNKHVQAMAMLEGDLTAHSKSVNMATMTPARRKRISAGTRKSSPAVEAFGEAIGIPHAGGPGYSIRSLSEKLTAEGFAASRQALAAIINGVYQAEPKLAARIYQLTGYRLDPKHVRS